MSTIQDYRRTSDYDSAKRVDKYLNQPEVKVLCISHPHFCLLPDLLELCDYVTDGRGAFSKLRVSAQCVKD